MESPLGETIFALANAWRQYLTLPYRNIGKGLLLAFFSTRRRRETLLTLALFLADYHFHHKPRNRDTTRDNLSRALFELHINKEANEVLSALIQAQISTNHAVKAALDGQEKNINRYALDVVSRSTLLHADPVEIRIGVDEVMFLDNGHLALVAFIERDLQLWRLAAGRMAVARTVIDRQKEVAEGKISQQVMVVVEEAIYRVYKNMSVVLDKLVRELGMALSREQWRLLSI